MFKFPKLIEVVVGIIKIAKSIKADDLEKKFGGALQQWALRGNRYQSKYYLCQNVKSWVCGPCQIILLPRTEC